MAAKQPEGYRVTTDSSGNIKELEVLVDGKWEAGEKGDASEASGKSSDELFSSTLSSCPGCTCWYWDGSRWRWYCC